MEKDDSDANLGPQMLAIDTKRFKSYRLVPKSGDLKDKKAKFPNGEYLSPFILLTLDGEDLGEWLFVVADHKCSNGVIYDGTGQSVFKPTVAHAETLTCDIPGIWKSNFDKIYRFSQTEPGVLAGEQIAGDLLIDKMEQKADAVSIAYRYEGKTGSAKLKLHCQENKIVLKGTYRIADRSGDWVFSKLKNVNVALSGEKIFTHNCSACHYIDRKDRKVGPSLLGLFKNPQLPDSGKAASEDNVRRQITDGGSRMPALNHLKGEELGALVDFLKTR
jgi:hypothetical protein